MVFVGGPERTADVGGGRSHVTWSAKSHSQPPMAGLAAAWWDELVIPRVMRLILVIEMHPVRVHKQTLAKAGR
jgi:hypothetical protein